MRLYRVSTDTSEKEKVIGGLLTMGQGLWLGLGLALIMGITFLLANVIGPLFAFIIGLIVGVGVGGGFAFLKIRGLPLATYIRMRLRFNKVSKFLINDLNYKPKNQIGG